MEIVYAVAFVLVHIGIVNVIGIGIGIVTSKCINRVMGTVLWPLACLASAPLPTYQLITR